MAYLERLGAAALIGGAVTAVAAGPTAAETLRDAFLDAYANNPVLNQQRAQQRSVDEQVPQAKLGLRPTVGVTLSGVYNRTYNSQSFLTPPGRQHRHRLVDHHPADLHRRPCAPPKRPSTPAARVCGPQRPRFSRPWSRPMKTCGATN